jgi:hypothetical protein
MWAGLIDFAPTDFDYVDTFTETDVYAFDNTCSWTYGVPLQGFPNQCGFRVKEDITGCPDQPPEPDPGSCFNGAYPWLWDPNTCQWTCTRGVSGP